MALSLPFQSVFIAAALRRLHQLCASVCHSLHLVGCIDVCPNSHLCQDLRPTPSRVAASSCVKPVVSRDCFISPTLGHPSMRECFGRPRLPFEPDFVTFSVRQTSSRYAASSGVRSSFLRAVMIAFLSNVSRFAKSSAYASFAIHWMIAQPLTQRNS